MPPSRALPSRALGRVFNNIQHTAATSKVPLYLCPAFRSLSLAHAAVGRQYRAPLRPVPVRRLHTESGYAATDDSPPLSEQPTRTLPLQCHGCGALSQTTVPGEAGYYNLSRRGVRLYLGLEERTPVRRAPNVDHVVQQTLQSVDVEALEKQGVNLTALLPERAPETRAVRAPETPPLCERCHELLHHSSGKSIYHPSIKSLRDTIKETPYKYNHVYHVLDAADFPMSVLPRLHHLLEINLRSRNRRSKKIKFRQGRLMEMSFIITRADLLAPTKEQVDSVMQYLINTLHEALGRLGERVRLGNVHCVSARCGWWVSELKEKIWERGGAGWMVGKANVGKSQLFEAVFPKGRMKSEATKPRGPVGEQESLDDPFADVPDNPLLPGRVLGPTEEFSLLPPPRPETDFPAMPTVSPLPGTTASPIRVPFGGGRGELIDLPGLPRSKLELHVRENRRDELVMKDRIIPTKQVLMPGKSLLLGGGLIRLTPRDELTFLAYAFTPIMPHVTSTSKAVAVQTEAPNAPRVESITVPGTGARVRHAGAFQLRYDVTKAHTGPLTRRNGVGLRVSQLPYRVLGIDILIEGCGWVELTVQVRTKHLYPEPTSPAEVEAPLQSLDLRPDPVNMETKNAGARRGDTEPRWPVIDVYTPDGKFIGYRPPMNAWVLNQPPKRRKSRRRFILLGKSRRENRIIQRQSEVRRYYKRRGLPLPYQGDFIMP